MRLSRGAPEYGTASRGICAEGGGVPRTVTQSIAHVPSDAVAPPPGLQPATEARQATTIDIPETPACIPPEPWHTRLDRSIDRSNRCEWIPPGTSPDGYYYSLIYWKLNFAAFLS